jgi:hypothetical protein
LNEKTHFPRPDALFRFAAARQTVWHSGCLTPTK